MPTVKKYEITLPNGEKICVYPISNLANALGRSSLTIRRWEKLGIIPDTFFVNNRGYRMYSQEQIDIIVQCAEEAGIQRGRSIADTEFSVLCHNRLDQLKKKYSSKTD